MGAVINLDNAEDMKQKRIIELEKELSHIKEDINTELLENNRSLRNEVNRLTEDDKIKSNRIIELETEIKSIKKNNEEWKQSILEEASRSKNISKGIADSNINELQRQLTLKDRTVREQSNQIKSLTDEKEALKKTVDEQQIKLESRNKEIDMLVEIKDLLVNGFNKLEELLEKPNVTMEEVKEQVEATINSTPEKASPEKQREEYEYIKAALDKRINKNIIIKELWPDINVHTGYKKIDKRLNKFKDEEE